MSTNPSLDLSIVIPYYNAERSVMEIYNCMCDCLISTFNSFEIIIIDDCSNKIIDTDELKIIHSTKKLVFERLQINKGQSYATGFGITKAKGNLIITLDDDIIVNIDFITTISSYYKKNNLDALYCLRNKNAQHSIFRRLVTKITKWILYFMTKKKVSSIRLLNAKIKEQIKSCIDRQNFSLEKIIYSHQNIIGFTNIDVESIGKTRYDFMKLFSVLKQYIGFKI